MCITCTLTFQESFINVNVLVSYEDNLQYEILIPGRPWPTCTYICTCDYSSREVHSHDNTNNESVYTLDGQRLSESHSVT